MRHLYIAGVDRWNDYLRDTLQIEQVLTQAVDTCSFSLRGEKPEEGQEVIIEDDALGRLFGGIIDRVQLADYAKDAFKVWQVDAQDYTYQLDRKLVVETYSNMAADAIARDIITKYGGGVFTTNHIQTGAPVVEEIIFDYVAPSAALKDLADYVGWDWYIDYYRDVWFFNPASLGQPAPMTLEPGGYFRNLKHTIDQQGLRNRVYVRGGTMLSDPWTYEVKADGSARAWVLPHKPHELSVKVGGVAKTVGIENVDDEATKDFLMNYEEKYVRCSAQTPTPAAGTTLSFTYRYDIDVITMVEDVASQQAIAKVQGGDGVYEHVIVDDSLTTIDAAEAAGNADLREHANPQIKGSFETEVPGWSPGQLVTINLPDRGIQGTFLVQKVTIVPTTPELWTYRVEYGGRLLGIADWLQALWKAQQKKKLNETALLHKFHYGAETAKVTDEVEGTLRTPPWKVEQGLEVDLGDKSYSKTETTQADFQAGTLTNVVATAAGELTLQGSAGNVAPNPSFQGGLTGWAIQLNSGNSITHDTTQGYDDSQSARMTNNAGGICWLFEASTRTFTGGWQSATFRVKGTPGAQLQARFHNYSGGAGSIFGPTITLDGTWQLYTMSQNREPGDYRLIIELLTTGSVANIDAVQIGYIALVGSRLSPVYDLSPVDQVASSTISWNATLPANTSLAIETNLSLDGGITWQGWQVCMNGGAIPGITEGIDLSKARLQIRQTLSTTDTTVTPQLHDVTVAIRPLVQFATVGGLMIVWQPGSEAWAQPQYRTSTDGITWSAWQGVDPAQRGPIEVPNPGYVRLRANGRVQARNWKKPFDQTDVVCGFVMAAS